MPPVQIPKRQGPLFDPPPELRLPQSARRAAVAALADLIAAVLGATKNPRPGGNRDETR